MSQSGQAARFTVRQADLLVGAIFLVLGAVIVNATLGMTYSNGPVPGAAFLPRWTGICLIAAGIGIVASRVLSRTASHEPLDLPENAGLQRVGLIAMLLLGIAITFERLGFLVTMVVACFVLSFVLERQALVKSVVFALGVPIFFYLVFAIWLSVPLPKGLVGV